ncbi:hypothetical protein HNQ56_000071 [Anaerotaenia torta]|uniref:CehA/McbA family metallohydrolase n=1 Tax=Anaerotaenia torta TaxID=433293 RepID=UPI003D1D698F
MSKYRKFLSTGYDILKGIDPDLEGNPADQSWNLDKFQNILQWLEALCYHQKLYYAPRQRAELTGLVQVTVRDETGRGVPAQVKFFPEEAGRLAGEARDKEDKVTFFREITDWQGKLETELPAGNYFVEISRGSEYEISAASLKVTPGGTSRIEEELKLIWNLRKEGWYAGDLHHHSIYSSPAYGGTDPVVETPQLVSCSMAAMGASFGALSDHHNVLNHEEWKACKREGFTPILSKEISTSNGHVMALGVEQDIIYRIPEQENRSDDYLRNEFIRITGEIKNLGGLPQINHPCDLSRAISWNPRYNDIIGIFETMEIWNGSSPMIKGSTNEKAFRLWKELLEQGRYIPATAGSDTHNIYANDYHVYFDRMDWLMEQLCKGSLSLPEEMEEEISYLCRLLQEMLPILKKWANHNLTSAGVRTYAYVPGEVTQEKLLTALKKGHSFLTNGPVLIPEIGGKHPGETVSTEEDRISIRLKLVSNRPLKQVMLHRNGNRVMRIPLEAQDAVQSSYDYSRILSEIDIKETDWIFFVASDDCTNMAVTNPIFMKRNSPKS